MSLEMVSKALPVSEFLFTAFKGALEEDFVMACSDVSLEIGLPRVTLRTLWTLEVLRMVCLVFLENSFRSECPRTELAAYLMFDEMLSKECPLCCNEITGCLTARIRLVCLQMKFESSRQSKGSTTDMALQRFVSSMYCFVDPEVKLILALLLTE